jgi:uncharacterized protein YybS (DUF2232 family)
MASAVTESALLAALSALLYMSSWTPLLGQLVMLCCAAPLTVAGVRHGGGRAALASLCATIVVGLVGGPTEAFLFAIPFGVLGAISGYFLHSEEDPGRIQVLGAGYLFVAITPATILLERALGLPDSVLEMQRGLVWFFAWPFGLVSDWLHLQVKLLLATGLLVPLTFFVVFAAVIFYANHLLAFLVMWRLRIPCPLPANLHSWRTPRRLLHVTPVLALIALATGPLSGTIAASLALNALVVALFVAYIGGFALVAWRLAHSRLRPLARMGVSILVMFPGIPVAVALGLADAVWDLRSTDEKKAMKPLARF